MMPSVPDFEPSVLASEAECSKQLYAGIHSLKLTANSNAQVNPRQEITQLKVQIAKLVKSLKTDKPAKANQSVKEQMQTELQQLKQKGLLTAYKTDDPCEVCEARLKLKLDVKHDPQIQALQEQIQKTFAELDKVDDELRQRRLDLGRTQKQKGRQTSVKQIRLQE
jgi:hypothetical protein